MSAQPLGSGLVAPGRDLVHARADFVVSECIRHAGQAAAGGETTFRDDGDRRLGQRPHLLGEGRAGAEPGFDRSPIDFGERDEEIVAVLEVPVDRAAGHPRPPGDVLESRALVALLTDQLAGSFQQLRSRSISLIPFGLLPAGCRSLGHDVCTK